MALEVKNDSCPSTIKLDAPNQNQRTHARFLKVEMTNCLEKKEDRISLSLQTIGMSQN
jgi:hypothetical protein